MKTNQVTTKHGDSVTWAYEGEHGEGTVTVEDLSPHRVYREEPGPGDEVHRSSIGVRDIAQAVLDQGDET